MKKVANNTSKVVGFKVPEEAVDALLECVGSLPEPDFYIPIGVENVLFIRRVIGDLCEVLSYLIRWTARGTKEDLNILFIICKMEYVLRYFENLRIYWGFNKALEYYHYVSVADPGFEACKEELKKEIQEVKGIQEAYSALSLNVPNAIRSINDCADSSVSSRNVKRYLSSEWQKVSKEVCFRLTAICNKWLKIAIFQYNRVDRNKDVFPEDVEMNCIACIEQLIKYAKNYSSRECFKDFTEDLQKSFVSNVKSYGKAVINALDVYVESLKMTRDKLQDTPYALSVCAEQIEFFGGVRSLLKSCLSDMNSMVKIVQTLKNSNTSSFSSDSLQICNWFLGTCFMDRLESVIDSLKSCALSAVTGLSGNTGIK